MKEKIVFLQEQRALASSKENVIIARSVPEEQVRNRLGVLRSRRDFLDREIKRLREKLR